MIGKIIPTNPKSLLAGNWKKMNVFISRHFEEKEHKSSINAFSFVLFYVFIKPLT